jgi:hypothetical protein
MLLAQAIVERGILDAMVAGVWSAVMRVNQFVGTDDTKWWLIGAAVVLGYIFLKPRR